MGCLLRRLAAVSLLSLSTLAFLGLSSAQANLASSGDLDTIAGFSDQLEQSAVSGQESVDQTGRYTKIVTHASFPGVRLRLTEPTLCDPNVQQYSGYLDDLEADNHYFFWFFESRNSPTCDPLTLWLNGGPGQSSMIGLFMELGPCTIKSDLSGLSTAPYSWNTNSSLLFVDQPVGVGFSYGNDTSSSAEDAARGVYAMLQLFFKEFPQYQRLNFHVGAESYGGHYGPAVGDEINRQNKRLASGDVTDVQHINLKSILIGNGLTDPKIQFGAYEEMACRSSYGSVLSDDVCAEMKENYPECARRIENCYNFDSTSICFSATAYCLVNVQQLYLDSGKSVYDVRKTCDDLDYCYEPMRTIEQYLNQTDVQNAIGAEVEDYKLFSRDVFNDFLYNGDYMRGYHFHVARLLEDGIRVLLYVGDADYICNWYGNKAWALALDWSGQQAMQDAEDKPWFAKGVHIGDARSSGPFTFVRLFGAGHYAPYDKRAEAWEIFKVWIKGDYFV